MGYECGGPGPLSLGGGREGECGARLRPSCCAFIPSSVRTLGLTHPQPGLHKVLPQFHPSERLDKGAILVCLEGVSPP